MQNKIIVTFDFDGTLSRKDVQEYAIELIERGIDVWVECMSSSRTQNLIRSRNLNINNCNSLKHLTAIAYTLC